MRFVVAVLVLLVFAPAARAEVTFTGVPAGPTNVKTFDVGFNSPDADHFDCVHVFPDLGTDILPGCTSPFAFRDLVDGRHELRVTATDAAGAKTEGIAVVTVDTEAPPAPTIGPATPDQRTVTLSGTTTAGTTVAVFDGTTKLGDASVTDTTWNFVARNLARGAHTLTAVASDAAHNDSDPSAAREVTIAGPPLPPTIDVPIKDAVNQRPVTLGGTTEPGTTLQVFDGTVELLPKPVPDGGTWAMTADLPDGVHAIKVTATDASGTSEAVREITIDTVVPQLTVSDLPGVSNLTGFDVAFGASEPVVFDCLHIFPEGEEPFPGCDPPFELRDLVDGTHTVRVTATDPAGNAVSKTVSVRVDTVAPAPVEPAQTGASEFTFTGEAGATFECSVDGSPFAACASPQRLSGLAAGDHTFAVKALDAAGNVSGATTRTFTIAEPPAATPEPTPIATAAATPVVIAPVVAPAAVLGRVLVARTVSGKVYVRRPATATALDLGTVTGIPVGTEIDARKGRVRLTAAATRGKAAHRAEFFGGVFVVTQAADDSVVLRLSEPFGSCAKKTGTRVRKLWGDGKGRFRTLGLNSIATVRGTRWLVQDTCEGTLTRVSQGIVSVRDTAKRKTFLVRSGRKYLAVPKKRK